MHSAKAIVVMFALALLVHVSL